MTSINYQPRDKVLITIILREGSEDIPLHLGNVVTIKSRHDNEEGVYTFFESDRQLRACCFVPYHYSSDTEKGGYYNGWPNRETDEAATVFFNNVKKLNVAKCYLVDAVHVDVVRSASAIGSSFGSEVCVHSILKQYTVDRLRDKDISSERYHAIINDIGENFKQRKPTLRARAQAIADYSNAGHLRDATSFIEGSALLPPVTIPVQQEIKSIMKIETKHFVNEQDITTMSIEEKLQLIKNTEDKINELQAITTKSKMVTAETKKLQDFLTKAVELFDN